MGPRPFGRGRGFDVRKHDDAALLQWGRDLSAAEGSHSVNDPPAFAGLQWGRDLSAAEGALPSTYVSVLWSFNGAATFRPRKASDHGCMLDLTSCFNGAATFRPRKVPADLTARLNALRLQWGRDLSAAEGHEHRLSKKNVSVLQWGRDLSAAEGSDSISLRGLIPWLQWGRDLSAAEGHSRRDPKRN